MTSQIQHYFGVLLCVWFLLLLPPGVHSDLIINPALGGSAAAGCSTCSYAGQCPMPSSPITLNGICMVTFMAGDYSTKPQFSLTTTNNANAIIVGTSGVVTGLKLFLRSYAQPGLMQIRDANFQDLTLTMESTRSGTITSSTISLKYGVQHSLTFSSFSIGDSTVTMTGATSYATSAFVLSAATLSFDGANIRLPVPFTLNTIPSILVRSSSTLEMPSLGVSPSITIQDSSIVGLDLGIQDPSPSLLTLDVSGSTVDRSLVSPPSPFVSDDISIASISITGSILYDCPITSTVTAALTTPPIFRGTFTNSPIYISTTGPSLAVTLGGSFEQSKSSISPIVSVSGQASETTVTFAGSTPTTFLRSDPSNPTNLCDLSVFQLQMSGTSTAYPSLDYLCVGGTVTSSANMVIKKSIRGVGSSTPLLTSPSSSPSTTWTLSSIVYGVDIVTSTSILYKATSPSLGIRRSGAATSPSITFNSPQINVAWDSSETSTPNYPYPFIDFFTNTSTTASSTNAPVVFTHSGAASSPLIWSFGPLPTPSQPIEPTTPITPITPITPTEPTQSCPQPQPGPTFKCIDGNWVSDVSVEQPVIVLPGSGQIIVNGNLTVNQSITFNGPGSTVIVNGCAFITGPITIILTESDLDRLGGAIHELLNQSGCANATDLSGAEVIVLTPSGSCRTVTLTNVGSSSSLSVLFDISTKGCSKKKNLVVIIVPVVVGVVIIAGLIASLLYWQHYNAMMNPKTPEEGSK